MKDYILKLFANSAVKSSLIALGKAVLTAALSTLGIAMTGCSIYGSGIGATM